MRALRPLRGRIGHAAMAAALQTCHLHARADMKQEVVEAEDLRLAMRVSYVLDDEDRGRLPETSIYKHI